MYYFASDTHLGLEAGSRDSASRERLLVRWLEEVSADAEAIFLVGDLFDFWFEYRHVVPKGYVRLLGKLAELTDRGIPIHLFPGNHDMWTFDYLEQECGVTIHHAPYTHLQLYGREVVIAHGDQLAPNGSGARLLNRFFRCRPMQRLFAAIHPRWGVGFGLGWSNSSRKSKPITHRFLEEREPIVHFARRQLEQGEKIDLFICGHTHCRTYYPLTDQSAIAFLGEWIESPCYGVLSTEGFTLHDYPGEA